MQYNKIKKFIPVYPRGETIPSNRSPATILPAHRETTFSTNLIR